MKINYCGISGGKDSAATALWCIHDSGYDLASLRFTFCNTHNEHALTYRHINILSNRFVTWGAEPIIWLEPERGFFDLAKWKGRFPSRKARFCTQWLKVIPTREDIARLRSMDHDVLIHSGVRWAESRDRAMLPREGFDDGFGTMVRRPIVDWSYEQVVAYHQRFGMPMNPLYQYGASRVGCFPCINSVKHEIRAIAEHFPERIIQIREQEHELGSTFFARNTTPERYRSLLVETKRGPMKVPTIDDVVEWSQTAQGGKAQGPKLFDYAGLACPSGAGMCE